jgi:hypothetical protein
MDKKSIVHNHYEQYLIQDNLANMLNNVDVDRVMNKIHLELFLNNN